MWGGGGNLIVNRVVTVVSVDVCDTQSGVATQVVDRSRHLDLCHGSPKLPIIEHL